MFIYGLMGLALSTSTSLVAKNKNQGNGYNIFKAYMSANLKQEDSFIIYPPKDSGQLIGIIAYMFPGHTMAITDSTAALSENGALEYHDSPFEMDIIRYSEIKKEGIKWLMIPTYANKPDISHIIKDQELTKINTFGWLSLQTGYQFTLYRLEPKP